MKIGINWIALALMVAVILVMRVKGLAMSTRYFVAGFLYFCISGSILYRLPFPPVAVDLNVVIAGVAVVFGVMYLVRGFRAKQAGY